MTLGIVLAVLCGLSWIFEGAVVGIVERRGYGTARQQRLGNAYVAAVALAVLLAGRAARPDSPAFALRCDLASAAWTVLFGAFNYLMMVAMGRAMLRGPNGVVWTIVQSGFVFPFALGVALGNTPLTFLNSLGALCVLAGVFFSGRAKDREGAEPSREDRGVREENVASSSSPRLCVGKKAWLAPALLGFLLCGANQCAICMASLGPEETRPTPLVRVLLICIGAFAGMATQGELLKSGASRATGGAKAPPAAFLHKICALYAVVYFLAVFFLQIGALDRLAAAGRIAIANPLMLASCLVGFGVYGALALHERQTRAGLLGIVFALAGIVLIAI